MATKVDCTCGGREDGWHSKYCPIRTTRFDAAFFAERDQCHRDRCTNICCPDSAHTRIEDNGYREETVMKSGWVNMCVTVSVDDLLKFILTDISNSIGHSLASTECKITSIDGVEGGIEVLITRK
jgi:hypothetical protein